MKGPFGACADNVCNMKIIVDVMGGDHAPDETVKGVCLAAQELDDSVSYLLVGDQNEINRVAEENELDMSRFEIVHTEAVIQMDDDPLCVVRSKLDSSMAVGLKLLAMGEGDAFVSTGNTGALFTGATLLVRKIKGVQRAGIGSIVPLGNPLLLLDSGANVTVTEENLEQFAVMGSTYMRCVYEIEQPRVGLLNNGTEACKGTVLQQTAYELLSNREDIYFIGNVEGSQAPMDACDVLVTDGFTGNIFLKTAEGMGKLLLGQMKEVLTENAITKLAALAMKRQLYGMKKQFDPSEHGGAPILGIAKPVVKAHGSSNAKAFKNAIRQAIDYANSNAISELSASMKAFAAQKKAAREQEKRESVSATVGATQENNG